MARSNTPKSYKCGGCGTLGHNKRTCPALGLAPKATPVKKPRAKKVEAAEVETVAVAAPVATEEQMDALRALVAQIEAAEAEEQTDEVTEPVAEVDAADVDEAFDAEPTDEELAEIEQENEDEAEALALLAEIEALAG